MPAFRFHATDPLGSPVHGTYDAANEAEVLAYLRRSHLTPVSVRRTLQSFNFEIGRPVRLRDLVVFTRMFSVMLKSGVPLDKAMRGLVEQIERPALMRALQRILIDVESGYTVADSMRQQPRVFEPIYVNMIQAGESSGTLDTLLERLADMLERNDAVRSKVRSAMIYPVFLLFAGFVAVGVLLTWVIPKFAEIFAASGTELPFITRAAVAVSNFLIHDWWLLLAAVAGAVMLARQAFRQPALRRRFAAFMLRTPVFGSLIRKGATARFARTFGTLVQSGIPIIEALNLSAATAGNVVMEEALQDAKAAIATGAEIAPTLKQSKAFDPLVTQMLAVGEQAGRIDEMLTHVADHYDREATLAVDGAMKLIEPTLLMVMGIIVLGILSAIYMPIMGLVNAVGGNGPGGG